MNKFTRRELAAAVSASAVLLGGPQVEAQTQPPSANPDEELKAARAQLREYSDQLDKFPLVMSAEPATTFKP